MTMIRRTSLPIVILALGWGFVRGVACAAEAPWPPEPPGGGVTGIVVDAATGEPVGGAYVAVDRSGDAAGANLDRLRREGLYRTAETDPRGRFLLGGLAVSADHPLMVTCPGYVRHKRTVALSGDRPDLEVRVALVRGAVIAVTVVDVRGTPLTGEVMGRIRAESGRLFVPTRADWPVTRTRTGFTRDGAVTFGELPAGRYGVDLFRFEPPLGQWGALTAAAAATDIAAEIPTVTFLGAISDLSVEAGERREVRVSSAAPRSEVVIEIAEDPYRDPDHPRGSLTIRRGTGRLLWANRWFFHPEDHRLGRVLVDGLVQASLEPGQPCRIRGLAPGNYSVFVTTPGRSAGFDSRACSVRGGKLGVKEEEVQTVRIAWRDPGGPSPARPRALLAFDEPAGIPSGSHAVSRICELLTDAVDPHARFVAAASLMDREATADPSAISVWDVFESLHARYGWEVVASDRTFTLFPPRNGGPDADGDRR